MKTKKNITSWWEDNEERLEEQHWIINRFTYQKPYHIPDMLSGGREDFYNPAKMKWLESRGKLRKDIEPQPYIPENKKVFDTYHQLRGYFSELQNDNPYYKDYGIDNAKSILQIRDKVLPMANTIKDNLKLKNFAKDYHKEVLECQDAYRELIRMFTITNCRE